jgi:hypothetical protein
LLNRHSMFIRRLTCLLIALQPLSSCKSSLNKGGSNTSSAKSTPQVVWTKDDVTNYIRQGVCAGYASIISGYATHAYNNGNEYDHFTFDKAANKQRIALGLQLLNTAHAEYTTSRQLSIWGKLLSSLSPSEYVPSPENYDWIKLQKYLYSLFQAESTLAIQRDASLTAQEQVSRLSLGSDNIWVDTFGKFFQTIDRPSKLSPLEAYLLIAPFNNYDPFITLGQLGWSTFRDVRLADFKHDRSLVQMTKYLSPVFPKLDDPQGQVYHFWGYAGRRLGEGLVMGHIVSDVMSYYWERIAQDDPEDFFTDAAGKWFAAGIEVVLNGIAYSQKSNDGTLLTTAQTYWDKNCSALAAGQSVPKVAGPRSSSTFQCMVEPGYEDAATGEIRMLTGFNHNIFMNESAQTLREEMDIANRCKGYAWLALTHVWQIPIQDFGVTKQRWERVSYAKWSVLDYQHDRKYVEGGKVRSSELR